jgi:hypothetical protein
MSAKIEEEAFKLILAIIGLYLEGLRRFLEKGGQRIITAILTPALIVHHNTVHHFLSWVVATDVGLTSTEGEWVGIWVAARDLGLKSTEGDLIGMVGHYVCTYYAWLLFFFWLLTMLLRSRDKLVLDTGLGIFTDREER